jgi:hypothetical protein
MKKLNQQETSILLNNYCVEDEPTTAQETFRNLCKGVIYWTDLKLTSKYFVYIDDELNQKVYCHKLDSHHFEIMDIEEL